MDIIENEFVQKVLTNANDVIPENSFDVCFVATASSSGLELATKIVKPLGTIGLKTTCSPESAVPLPHVFNDIVVKEITVNGSRCGPFQPALELLLKNLEMVEKTLSQMITSTYPLEKIETAMTKAAEKTSLKVQIDCTR